MTKLTRQGVRDLNSKQTNGKKQRGRYECEHVWTDWVSDDSRGLTAPTERRECVLCGNKEVAKVRY